MPKDTKNKMVIPVNEPVVSIEAKSKVMEALESGWLSSSGPFVSEFEETFARFAGRHFGIAVSNGTAALHIALLSLGIGKGDEVIVPAFAMGACFLSVLQSGAKPVFVDCELETYNIDPAKIPEKITPKTKAVMAVHTYGHPSEMDSILSIAEKYNLAVIEDAAEAHGASYKGKKCGGFGNVSCFSFYANKIITTGEGGMVLTDDEKIATEAKKFRDLYHSDAKRFIHDGIGYNYRLTNIQAAIGLGELSHINDYLAHKGTMANFYGKGLADVAGLQLPITKPGVKNVHWMYAVLVDENKFGMDRDMLRLKLKEKGIDTRDFFYPPEEQPALKNIIGEEKFPNAAYAGHNGLYLPSGLAITEKQLEYITDTIKSLSQT